ncbi:MAG: hypothetical protein ACLGI7_09820 [Gammaproteobacteria bacterium]
MTRAKSRKRIWTIIASGRAAGHRIRRNARRAQPTPEPDDEADLQAGEGPFAAPIREPGV